MRALLVAFAFVSMPFAARAFAVCGRGQVACGGACFSPASGQRCFQGRVLSGAPIAPRVVCGPGEAPCGTSCFHPAAGEVCWPGGVVCGPGQVACGDFCIDRAAGETCGE